MAALLLLALMCSLLALEGVGATASVSNASTKLLLLLPFQQLAAPTSVASPPTAAAAGPATSTTPGTTFGGGGLPPPVGQSALVLQSLTSIVLSTQQLAFYVQNPSSTNPPTAISLPDGSTAQFVDGTVPNSVDLNTLVVEQVLAQNL